MNYAQGQRNAGKNLTGIGIVAGLHVLIVWALVSGLARTVVDVIKAPIETKVIEEIKKPPPPPEVVVPPPPLKAPPPPFIPPPEVQIATPPAQPTITVKATEAPPAPQEIRPVAPKVEAAPQAAGPVNIRAVCTKMPQPELPSLNFSGQVTMVAKIGIQGGKVTTVEVGQIRGAPDRKAQRLLTQAVESAIREYQCAGDAQAAQEFVFNIE